MNSVFTLYIIYEFCKYYSIQHVVWLLQFGEIFILQMVVQRLHEESDHMCEYLESEGEVPGNTSNSYLPGRGDTMTTNYAVQFPPFEEIAEERSTHPECSK